MPAGTYTQANISLTNPQITILDTTVTPPVAKTITTMFASGLATATVSVNIKPVLTIQANVAQGLILDFNLRKSIQTDTSGSITGAVDPAFRATAELRREEFKMNYNQVVAAGIAAIGTTLKVELDIQAVQGESLPMG